MLPSIRLLWRCSSRANDTPSASLLNLIQAMLRKICNFSLEKTGKKKKKKKKPTPFLDWVAHGNPVIMSLARVVILLSFQFLPVVILLLVSRPLHTELCRSSCIHIELRFLSLINVCFHNPVSCSRSRTTIWCQEWGSSSTESSVSSRPYYQRTRLVEKYFTY